MTYIIAEAGSNWHTFNDAKESIAMAKACGADAVKFQYYTHKKLYGIDGEIKGALPREWIALLSEKARACGIDFMLSVFDVDDIQELAHHVDAWKVASCEFMYFDMYAAMRLTGKKIYASCGAQSLADVETLMHVENGKYRPDVLMYCCVEYPSRYHDLRHIDALVSRFPGVTIGYSDHSSDVFTAPVTSVRHGAKVIEKHFRLDHITGTPDAPHSLSTSDFKRMVDAIKKNYRYDMHAFQDDAVLMHKRRLKAIAPIGKGETLKFRHNYGFVRSKEIDCVGGSIIHRPEIEGKAATRQYLPGEPINPRDYI